jgi:chemotaxis protein MotB
MITRKIGVALASVVVATLAAGCVPQGQYNSLEAQYDALSQRLSGEIANQQVHLSRLQNAIRVDVNSELLFPSGGWQMPPDAAQTIAKIAPILAPYQQNHLLVKGYTDNTPIGPELRAQGVQTNVQLSQMRAQTVMNYLISQGVNPNMVSAQGFGESDPVASNDTAAGRAQNRRVDIDIIAPGG